MKFRLTFDIILVAWEEGKVEKWKINLKFRLNFSSHLWFMWPSFRINDKNLRIANLLIAVWLIYEFTAGSLVLKSINQRTLLYILMKGWRLIWYYKLKFIRYLNMSREMLTLIMQQRYLIDWIMWWQFL